MHVPALNQAVEMQALHVYSGSLYSESGPRHAVQRIALVHLVQLLLQAKF